MGNRSTLATSSADHDAIKVRDFSSPTEPRPRKPRPPIAPNGELLLLVGGPSSSGPHPIRVHALVLRNASPVFASMLQSPYNESTTLLAATPVSPARIALPEDDALAIEIICRVLHNCADSRVYDLCPAEVLRVAIAADKYDCTKALALAVAYWLSPGKLQGLMYAARDGCIGFGRCDLLFASYWFKCERVFGEVTQVLVLSMEGGSEGVVEGREGVGEVPAWRLALALEKLRNDLRLSLYTMVMDRRFHPHSITQSHSFLSLGWSKKKEKKRPNNGAISALLCSIDREPFSQGIMYMSVNEALRHAAVEMPLEEAGAYNCITTLRKVRFGQRAERGPWGRMGAKGQLNAALNRWSKENVRGLCLGCVHEQMECPVEEHVGGDGKGRGFVRRWLRS